MSSGDPALLAYRAGGPITAASALAPKCGPRTRLSHRNGRFYRGSAARALPTCLHLLAGGRVPAITTWPSDAAFARSVALITSPLECGVRSGGGAGAGRHPQAGGTGPEVLR